MQSAVSRAGGEEQAEDLSHSVLHQCSILRLVVRVAHEMEYSVDQEIQEHFVVGVAEFHSVLSGLLRTNDHVAQERRGWDRAFTFLLREGEDIGRAFLTTEPEVKVGHLLSINQRNRQNGGAITAQVF